MWDAAKRKIVTARNVVFNKLNEDVNIYIHDDEETLEEVIEEPLRHIQTEKHQRKRKINMPKI